MASLSDKVSLVLRWTSKLGRCLIRQSKRSCSEATTEKAISDKPSTGLRTRGSTKEQRSRDGRVERGSLRRGCDTLTLGREAKRVKGITLRELMTRRPVRFN